MLHNPGEENNPISIDDEEEKVKHASLLDEARNKAIIQEAVFTNEPMELCFAVVKTCIQGDLAIKNRELTKAIQKYFQEKLSIKISHEHFYPQIEPDYSDSQTQPKLTQILLYGVDFLTTNAIKDRLKAIQAEIQAITWINDSTCKIVCLSQAQADRVLKTQVKEIKLQDEEERLRDWFVLKPYSLYSFQRPLLARYVTSTQDLPRQVASKYLVYAEARKGLAPFLLKQFAAEDKYKAVVEEIEVNKRPRRRSRMHRRDKRDQNSQPFRSRSRDQKQRMRQQRQYGQIENMRGQRVNRFQRRQGLQQRELQQIRVIKYAHQQVQNKDDSYNFNSSEKDRSYELSSSPADNKIKKDRKTDFEFNRQISRNKALDMSICYKTKEKRGECDAGNDLDSELSFNDFGTFTIGKEKDPQQDNRMDYRYEPNVKGSQGVTDCSFLLRERSGLKQEESRSSFQENNSPHNDQQSEGSDFFDFRQSKPRPVESTLDSSFRYQKKPIERKKNKINTNFLNDDDSY